jgi:hypothetical protein
MMVTIQEVVKSCSSKCNASYKEILDDASGRIDSARRVMERLNVNLEDSMSKLRREVQANAIAAMVAKKFPLVCDHFLGAEWDLRVTRSVDGVVTAKEVVATEGATECNGITEVVVKVKRYASIQKGLVRDPAFGEGSSTAIGRVMFLGGRVDKVNFRQSGNEVRVGLPEGCPITLARRAYLCYAEIMECCARVVRHAQTSGSGFEVDEYNFRHSPDRPDIMALWMPSVEHLSFERESSRVQYDPAVLVKWNGHMFLMGFWDSPKKNPLDDILGKFNLSIPSLSTNFIKR